MQQNIIFRGPISTPLKNISDSDQKISSFYDMCSS